MLPSVAVARLASTAARDADERFVHVPDCEAMLVAMRFVVGNA
jgi:hypothetical protein